MSDIDQAVMLIRSGKLSIDQVLLSDQSGLLRPVPNQGVKVFIVGSIAGYLDQEVVFHEAVARALVDRGAATYTQARNIRLNSICPPWGTR